VEEAFAIRRGGMRVRAIVQNANLIAISPAGILTTCIITTTANWLHPYGPRLDVFVAHGDIEITCFPRLKHLATPWVRGFDARLARDSGHALGAQIHSTGTIQDDFITVWPENVPWFHPDQPRFHIVYTRGVGFRHRAHLRTTHHPPAM
jgi:hypothetical protein